MGGGQKYQVFGKYTPGHYGRVVVTNLKLLSVTKQFKIVPWTCLLFLICSFKKNCKKKELVPSPYKNSNWTFPAACPGFPPVPQPPSSLLLHPCHPNLPSSVPVAVTPAGVYKVPYPLTLGENLANLLVKIINLWIGGGNIMAAGKHKMLEKGKGEAISRGEGDANFGKKNKFFLKKNGGGEEDWVVGNFIHPL